MYFLEEPVWHIWQPHTKDHKTRTHRFAVWGRYVHKLKDCTQNEYWSHFQRGCSKYSSWENPLLKKKTIVFLNILKTLHITWPTTTKQSKARRPRMGSMPRYSSTWASFDRTFPARTHCTAASDKDLPCSAGWHVSCYVTTNSYEKVLHQACNVVMA